MNFTGKTAVITGGTSGIGLATARKFSELGARVLIVGSSARSVDAALKALGPDAAGVAADLADTGALDGLKALVERSGGKVDTLVCNAGICLTSRIDSLDEAAFDREMAINVKAALFTVKTCLPFMGPGATILFTTSVNDVLGLPGQIVYSATKAALRSAVRTLAAELAPRGIRVNSVAPGPIDTPIFDKFSSDPKVVAAAKEFEANLTQAKRLGRPGEIADAFAFLASDGATYVNGANLRVDGGWADI